MRSFLRLHQDGELILVNPDQIQTALPSSRNSTYIYLAGEDLSLEVDENIEDIDRMIALS